VRKLFELAELKPGGSVRFELEPVRGAFGPMPQEGFAVRTPSGEVRAYLNVCPHRASPVDVGDGRLFVATGEIECGAHGARFDPATGACRGGPCEGRGLSRLEIELRDGAAWRVASETESIG
jgi:nitrite reductase/ring-hydroxylating ferredoxin subunit